MSRQWSPAALLLVLALALVACGQDTPSNARDTAPPINDARFYVSSVHGVAPHTVEIAVLGPEDLLPDIEVDFGDGTSSYAPVRSHVYEAPGTYEIRVSYVDGRTRHRVGSVPVEVYGSREELMQPETVDLAVNLPQSFTEGGYSVQSSAGAAPITSGSVNLPAYAKSNTEVISVVGPAGRPLFSIPASSAYSSRQASLVEGHGSNDLSTSQTCDPNFQTCMILDAHVAALDILSRHPTFFNAPFAIRQEIKDNIRTAALLQVSTGHLEVDKYVAAIQECLEAVDDDTEFNYETCPAAHGPLLGDLLRLLDEEVKTSPQETDWETTAYDPLPASTANWRTPVALLSRPLEDDPNELKIVNAGRSHALVEIDRLVQTDLEPGIQGWVWEREADRFVGSADTVLAVLGQAGHIISPGARFVEAVTGYRNTFGWGRTDYRLGDGASGHYRMFVTNRFIPGTERQPTREDVLVNPDLMLNVLNIARLSGDSIRPFMPVCGRSLASRIPAVQNGSIDEEELSLLLAIFEWAMEEYGPDLLSTQERPEGTEWQIELGKMLVEYAGARIIEVLGCAKLEAASELSEAAGLKRVWRAYEAVDLVSGWGRQAVYGKYNLREPWQAYVEKSTDVGQLRIDSPRDGHIATDPSPIDVEYTYTDPLPFRRLSLAVTCPGSSTSTIVDRATVDPTSGRSQYGTDLAFVNPTVTFDPSTCSRRGVASLTLLASTNSPFRDEQLADSIVVNLDFGSTPLTEHTLTVAVAGRGSGVVTSSPEGIACETTCAAEFPENETVSLSVDPDSGSVFAGWSGHADCEDGRLTMTDSLTCTATFDVSSAGPNLTLRNGRLVPSSPAAGDAVEFCVTWENSGDTEIPYVSGEAVGVAAMYLDADRPTSARFLNYSHLQTIPPGYEMEICEDPFREVGGVATTGAHTIYVYTDVDGEVAESDETDNRLALSFDVDPAEYELDVDVNGSGTVTSSPTGISCGAECRQGYDQGTEVQLTATPSVGWQFDGWSGDADCSNGSVTMNGPRSCTATFSEEPAPEHLLSVDVVGSGSVTSSPSGIACGSDCQESFTEGAPVTLTPQAAGGWDFASWSGHGDCGDGSVTMNAPRSCTATFEPEPAPAPVIEDVTGPSDGDSGEVFNWAARIRDPDSSRSDLTVSVAVYEDGAGSQRVGEYELEPTTTGGDLAEGIFYDVSVSFTVPDSTRLYWRIIVSDGTYGDRYPTDGYESFAVSIDDPAPVADLVVTPTSGDAPLDVTLNACGSTDNTGVEAYEFATGDGGGTTTTSCSWSYRYPSSGTFSPTVTVYDTLDQTDTVAGSDVSVSPPTATRPNFVLENAYLSPANPTEGDDVDFCVTWRNAGDATAVLPADGNIAVSRAFLDADGVTSARFSNSIWFIDIPAGDSWEDCVDAFSGDGATPGSHSIYAYTDADQEVEESNENDNRLVLDFTVSTAPTDFEDPDMVIDRPGNYDTVYSSSIEVRGTVSDNSGDVRRVEYKVNNGDRVTVSDDLPGSDFAFTASGLVQGINNTITVYAYDPSGNRTAEGLNLFYE